MNALIESTKQVFGDRAQGLLEAGVIMPVTRNKTPALRGDWKEPTDPSQFNGRVSYGYAVKTGSVSGLTGVDFDGLVIPERYNTETSRGFHSWVPYAPGDKNRANINQCRVDVRGDGGYLVFASPNHSVVNTGLLERDEFQEWLTPVAQTVEFDTSTWDQKGEHPYVSEIKAHGYEVRMDWLTRRLASSLSDTTEGARNHTLYVSAAQIINLGGTEDQVRQIKDAAYLAGLDGNEIHKAMKNAQNAKEVIPVFHLARAWSEEAEAELKKRRVRNTIVLEHMVRLATEQHSMRPLVSLMALEEETGLTRKTIGNQLNMLIKVELLGKKVNPGRQPNGNLHPNNFILGGN